MLYSGTTLLRSPMGLGKDDLVLKDWLYRIRPVRILCRRHPFSVNHSFEELCVHMKNILFMVNFIFIRDKKN